MPRCFLGIEEELASRQPWVEEAQLAEICAAQELGGLQDGPSAFSISVHWTRGDHCGSAETERQP